MARIEQDVINSNAINLIGVGTLIKGEVICESDIRIDGNLNGNLTTKGKVIVGAGGKVQGEIHCKNSDISGNVDGKIIVSELLSLKATAKISGDIVTNKLAIEPNAVFTGSCNMGGNATSNADYKKEPEQKTDKSYK